MVIKAASLSEAKKYYDNYRVTNKFDWFPLITYTDEVGAWKFEDSFYLGPSQKDDGTIGVVFCEWYQE